MSIVGVFLTALFTTSLTMSAVILLLLLFHKLSVNKISAKSRYYMWFIVLLGLLIPFRPNIPIPFDPVQPPISFETSDISVTADFDLQAESNHLSNYVIIAEKSAASYTMMIFVIWMAVALALFSFHLWSYIRFASLVSRWGVTVKDEYVISILQMEKHYLCIGGREIKLKTCAFISSPMLIGFISPTILLPEIEMSSDELEYVFRHELFHYKHGDLWINLLVLIVSVMHFFNPFIYLMAKNIRSDCEAACDESVVAGNDTDRRKHYGETIIGFIKVKNAMTPILSTYFFGGSSSMKKRLSSIMNTNQNGKSLTLICAAALVLMIFMTGNVFASSRTSNRAVQYIDENKAKSIALEHAGIQESQTDFIKIRLDYDDGRAEYDVEFYSNNTEYDYEIDAISGNILEYEHAVKNYVASSNSKKHTSVKPSRQTASISPQQYIGEDKAKVIALEHAGFSESQVSRLKVELDSEDGIMVYEIEFNSGRIEYEYEINAADGSIVAFDTDYDD